MAVATGIGPIAEGVVYDYFGSYSALLLTGIPMNLVSGWLIGGLGPYPDWHNPLSYRVNTLPRPRDSVI